MNFEIEKINLPLDVEWKISRNSSSSKTNLVIRIEEEGLVGMGEVAPNVRYGESVDSSLDGFENFRNLFRADSTIEEMNELMDRIELSQSLRFGIESAFVSLACAKESKSLWSFLGCEEVAGVSTSFSLPIMEVSQLSAFIDEKNLQRFSSLKIKVNQDADEAVEEVARCYKGKLRIDANEAWTEAGQVLDFCSRFSHLPIEFIEQPMPADRPDEYLELKGKCPFPVIADESLVQGSVNDFLADRFDGVNVKLMKAGGILAGMKQLNEARRLGLKTMLGCMIETSLGISKAIYLAHDVDFLDLDGFLLLEKDPFGLVREKSGFLSLVT